jgi:hypothetical protein
MLDVRPLAVRRPTPALSSLIEVPRLAPHDQIERSEGDRMEQ